MTDHICPRCRGTGIARVAPYLVGLRDGDLHTMTACASLPTEKRPSLSRFMRR